MPFFSFYTLFQVFKVLLKNLKDSYSYIFVTNFPFLMDSLKPPHTFNSQSPLSMTKVFYHCSLNNATKTQKCIQHKCFQILHVSNISCKCKTFCRFIRRQNFWKICSMNICRGIQFSDF